MEPDFLVNEGDYGYPITHICKDTDGEPVDISDASSVRFRMGSIDPGAVIVVEAAASNEDDSNGTRGQVSYTLVQGDTDIAGSYLGYFVVTTPEGTRAFPLGRRLHVLISAIPQPE